MFINELIAYRFYTKETIKNLASSIYSSEDSEQIDRMLKKLLECYDTLQKYNILLTDSNNETMITIGSNTISLSTAVEVRDNIDRKIELMSSLIERQNDLDIFGLIEQRDKLIDELVLISQAIDKIDTETEIG